MDERTKDLTEGPPLDVAVIGGGINGCAIALEAARRGLRVALFEASDFGFGTTWRSTKLIHGGLRYLEHGDVRLVFESLRERAWLLKTYPHLVSRQRFLLPLVPWTRRPGWQLNAGLWMYDALSLFRGVPRHRRLSRERIRSEAPFLPDETAGGFLFYDARARSPERLALELALRARDLGAIVLNHAAVTRIVTTNGRVTAIAFEHKGEQHVVGTRTVINAAGPWVDAVNRLTGKPPAELLGVTRGTHIVLDVGDQMPRTAVLSTAKSDGRVFFAVPQDDLLLVGTTDVRYDGNPGDVQPTREDTDYLLEEAKLLLPGLDVGREQVRYAYAGLRPLQKVRGGPEEAITRRHQVVDHGENGGPAGLYSVIGGKLSTFRPLAREAVDHVGHGVPVPESNPAPANRWRWELTNSGLERRTRRHLRIYGDAVGQVIREGREVICEHTGAIRGEVVYTVRHELAATLSDILLRRTGIAWGSCRGLCCRDEVAAIAQQELGWDDAQREQQVREFEADVDRHLPPLDCIREAS